MTDDREWRVGIGRADGGSFLRVVHLPTGVARTAGPPLPRGDEAVPRLIEEIRAEIEPA